MVHRMRPIIFSLLVLLLACQDSSNDVVFGLGASTSKDRFSLGEDIIITISNDNDGQGWIRTCCSSLVYYVDRFESGSWVLYASHEIPCLKSCPEGYMSVTKSQPYESIVGDEIKEEGTYRLKFLSSLKFLSLSDELIEKELISNSFFVQ